MRKALVGILTLLLMLSLLTACTANNSGGNTATTLTGKYMLVSITAEGETHDEAALAAIGADSFMEFLDEGKCSFTFFGDAQEGMFTVDGSSVTVTIDGEGLTGKVEGNKITFDAPDGEEGSMVFEKK